MRLGGIYVDVGAKTTKLKRDLAKAKTMTGKAAVHMNNQLDKISFRHVGIAATAFSATMVLLTKKVIDVGRGFESTMKTVQAWSGASDKGLKSLTAAARKMGATTEHSATQAAGALKFLAAAGFSADQSIKALPQTLDLATAGQVDLAIASDITTDVLTAFGLKVSDLNRVNDAFITTTSSSNTNVTMLGMSMKMVAPTAKLFGMSVEQTAAMLGTLANAGVKAEMAGSGLNMVLLKSAKAAKKLGLDAGTPLVEVLRKMKEEQWGAVEIGEAFGARQVKTAAILMDSVDAYEALTKKINENAGATQKLADIVRDSLDNDLKILNSTIQEQLLKTYADYKDEMRLIVQGTSEWVTANADVVSSGFGTWIEGVVPLLKVAAGSALLLAQSVSGIGLIIKSFGGWTPYKGSGVTGEWKEPGDELKAHLKLQSDHQEKLKGLAAAYKRLNKVTTTGHKKQAKEVGRITEEFDNLHDGIWTTISDVDDFGYITTKTGETFFHGWKRGYEDLKKNQRDWGDHGEYTVKQFAQTAKSSMSTFINPLKDDFLDIESLWDSMLDSMDESFADALSDMAAQWAMNQLFGTGGGGGGVGSFFGGGSGGGGSGGVVGNIATQAGKSAAGQYIKGTETYKAAASALGYGGMQTTGIATTGSMTTSGGATYGAVSGSSASASTAGTGMSAGSSAMMGATAVGAVYLAAQWYNNKMDRILPGGRELLEAYEKKQGVNWPDMKATAEEIQKALDPNSASGFSIRSNLVGYGPGGVSPGSRDADNRWVVETPGAYSFVKNLSSSDLSNISDNLMYAPFRVSAGDADLWKKSIAQSGVPASVFFNQAKASELGYASGTSYVPQTGPALVHEGERILSKADNKSLIDAVGRGGGLPIINVYIGDEQLDTRMERVADGVRVKAEQAELGTQRAYL